MAQQNPTFGNIADLELGDEYLLQHNYSTWDAYNEALDGGFEEAFKDWKTDRSSLGTARTYWSKAKSFPYFELLTDHTLAIDGAIETHLQKPDKGAGHLTAIKSLMTYLYQEWESEALSPTKQTLLKIKTKGIQESLEIPESSKGGDGVNVKEKHIHSDHIVEMLRKAEPKRAKMWYVLYSCGMRIGELKRLNPTNLQDSDKFPPYGAIKIRDKDNRGYNVSKSDQGRNWVFLNKYSRMILESAPRGKWVDENGIEWENVFYPEMSAQLENYYMEKFTSHPKHGVGIERKTPHCFRHARITHLTHDHDEMSIDDIRLRVGHGDESTTRQYIETEFDRPPHTIENYCEKNNIDIWQVIMAEEE